MKAFFYTALFALIVCAAPVRAEDAMRWSALLDGSHMTFLMKAIGKEWPVAAFEPEVYFDPENMSGSRFSLTADLSPVFTQDHIAKSGFADSIAGSAVQASRPAPVQNASGPNVMRFESGRVMQTGRNTFRATGTFMLNGQSEEMEVPFRLSVQEDDISVMRITLTGRFAFAPKDFPSPTGLAPSDAGIVPVTFRFAMVPYDY
ncbi:MAG: YceI family protein [Alphaproteobacteria bacterium]|nr:YceI family protein [Alphaproteobacteria bacterium]